MMEPRLTEKAMREMEELHKLEMEALRIFDLVVAEWESDPTSIQCFDLRTVERAIEISKRMKKLTPGWMR